MSDNNNISDILSKENEYWDTKLKTANNFTELFNGLKDGDENLTQKESNKNFFNYNLEEKYINILSKNINVAYIYLIAALCLTINKLDGRQQISFDIPKTHGDTFETLPFLEEIQDSETIRELLNNTKKIYISDLANQHIDIDGLIQREFPEFGNHRDILLIDKINSDSRIIKKNYKLLISVQNNKIINFESTVGYLDSQELVAFGQTYVNLLKVIMNPLKRDLEIPGIPLIKNKYQVEDKFTLVSDIASTFEKVARKNNKIAVKFKNEEISFSDLNKKANQVANMIQTSVDLSHQAFIGIMMNKSIDMIAAIFGILKLHKAYVPIDPEYPTKRIEEIIKETNLKTIFAEDNIIHINSETEHVRVLYPKQLNNYATQFKNNKEQSSKENYPCYIIFTSGTTGRPKPVVVSQLNVLNLISNVKDLFKIGNEEKWTMFHQFSFDFSVWEIFGSLLNGNTLVIVDDETTKDSKKFLSLINKEKISILCQTPNAFYPLAERIKNSDISVDKLKYIFFGGEMLNPEKLYYLKEKYPNINFINMYGITETTVHVTYKNLSLEDMKKSSSNIGKPIQNYHIFILNKYKNILPVGIPGEMYISGIGLAEGYLNMPDLTNEKFIQTNMGRLYRSGDFAVKNNHNDLIYLGRIDDQVEIRGHRIELQEISNALLEIPNVADAFVTVTNKNSLSGLALVAYFITKNDDNSFEPIRSYLKTILPDYFIPTFWVPIDKFPLKRNGKIDVAKLPDPKKMKIIQESPSSPTEKKISSEWSEILGNTKFDINDNFFKVGGNSIAVTMLANRIKNDFNLEIPVSKLFELTTIKTLGKYIDTKISKISVKTQKYKYSNTSENNIETNIFEMSPSQKRIFVMAQENSNLASYIIPVAFKINGYLHYEKIKAAIYALIKRHESLRTTFHTYKGKYIQKVEDFIEPDFTFKKVDHFSQKQIKKTISEILYPFNLKKGPLFRIRVVQTANETYIFFVIHHIIFDGESVKLLLKDFNDYYLCSTFKEPLSQYHTFSQRINNEKFDSNKIIDKFKGFENQAHIITDYPRSKNMSIHIDKNVSKNLNLEISDKVIAFCKNNKITDFVLYTAIWEVLLSKYSSQNDVSVGFPVSGRSSLSDEHAIGMFVNTIALRTIIDNTKNFRDLLKQVKSQITQALDEQDYPFEKLLDDIHFEIDETRNPLFDTVVTITDDAKGILSNFCNFDATEIQLPDQISKFDLHLEIVKNLNGKGNYKLNLIYDSSLFAKANAEYIIDHYINLLKNLISEPNKAIRDIGMLSNDESKTIDDYLCNNKQSLDMKDDFLYKLSVNIKKYPEKTAISSEAGNVSYSDLNEKIGNYISLLKENNITEGDAVALYTGRNGNLLPIIYAILSCGAFYIPVDPDYPMERTKYIISNSNCKLIIGDSNEAELFKQMGIRYVNMNKDVRSTKLTFTEFETVINQKDLAYIIYTSGTTGKPKGVKITRYNLAHIIKSLSSKLGITSQSKIMFKSSYCFDMSIPEIFMTIANGGETYVLPARKEGDPTYISNKIIDRGITDVQFIPSLLSLFVEQTNKYIFPNIHHLVVGGEVFPTNLLKNCKKYFPNAEIINGYGPTENTVYTTFMDTNKSKIPKFKSLPIGYPLEGVDLKVVDKFGSKVGIGVPGKLMISGDGLFSGYLNRKDLSNAAFDSNGFYNSKDLVRINSSKSIEFLGRIDSQVKVRGYRIELDEVKNAIESIPGVKRVILKTNKENIDNTLITAYLLLKKNIDVNSVKTKLSSLLPTYMIPGIIKQIREVPLTFNGKVDERHLEEHVIHASIDLKEKPRSETERKVIKLYKTITGSDDIGVISNFFEVGGQSLSAIKLQQAIEETFHKKIEIADIFKHPVVKDIADFIDNASLSDEVIIPSLNDRKIFPVTDGQKDIYIADRVQDNSAFNVYVCLKVKNLNIKIFKDALKNVLNKYEVLSARFDIDSSGKISQKFAPRLEINDVIEIYKEKQGFTDKAMLKIKQFITQKFDLNKGKLFKVLAIASENEDTILTFCMHHIISDAWSLRVLIQDLFSSYIQGLNHKTMKLKDLKFQFKDYVMWKQRQNNQDKKDNEYWINAFKNINIEKSRANMLPRDIVLNKGTDDEKLGSSVSIKLTKEITKVISNLQRKIGVSKLSIYFAAIALSIYFYTKDSNIVIGTSLSGRENNELNDQIGYFVNTLPLICKIDSSATVKTFVLSVADSFYDLMKHQNETENKLVSDLNINTNRNGGNYFYNIMVQSITNDSLIKLEKNKNLNIKVIPVDNGTLKHDLTFSFSSLEDDIYLAVDYSNRLYNKDTILQEIDLISKLLVEMDGKTDYEIGRLIGDIEIDNKVIPKLI